MVNPNDEYYDSKWKSIVNILHKSDLDVAAIAKAGKRAKLQHHCESDLDVIFCVNGDPDRTDFYPDLMELLEIKFPKMHNHKVYPGENYNVVHLETKQGGIFDFVLLSEDDFEQQHGNVVEWRRENL